MSLWQLILRPIQLPEIPLGIVFVIIVLAALYIVEPRHKVRRR